MMLARRSDASQTLLRGWLLFSVGCAGIAGVLSLLVAGARIPAVGWLIPTPNLFYVAMVGHVTFGLIIWLLAFVVAITVFFAQREGWGYSARIAHYGLALAMLGAGVLLGSVLIGRGEPVLTDYVPVLTAPAFFFGYALFALGIVAALVNYLPAALRQREKLSLPAFGMVMAVVCALIALVALFAAMLTVLPAPIIVDYPYQSLFWGVGHVLQYVYVTTMVAVWFVLARAALGPLPIKSAWARAAFMLAPLLALPAPFAYFALNPTYWGNLRVPGIFLDAGLSLPVLLQIALLSWAVWQAQRAGSLPPWRRFFLKPEGAALFLSVALYFAGAALEPRASLGTTRVPAHYHGMVVGGVSTALMGMSYYFLRQMKLPVGEMLARVQLYVFGLGVLISITGLAWAGALGAPRKTFDAAAGSASSGQMNFMGIGAALAAVGGVLFVAAVLGALLKRRQASVGDALPTVSPQ